VRLLTSYWKDTVNMEDIQNFITELGVAAKFGQRIDAYLVPDDVEILNDKASFRIGKLQELLDNLNEIATQMGIEKKVRPRWSLPSSIFSSLPRSWITPRYAKGKQADFLATTPRQKAYEHVGNRTPRHMHHNTARAKQEELELMTPYELEIKSAIGHRPMDSRRRSNDLPLRDDARLLNMTNVAIRTVELFETSEEATYCSFAGHQYDRSQVGEEWTYRDDPGGTTGEMAMKMLHEYDPPSMDHVPVMPNMIYQFNLLRAHFRGGLTRSSMAKLQCEHVAASKIQLAFWEHHRRRQDAARVLQSSFRARLLRDILRGLIEAKRMVLRDDHAPLDAVPQAPTWITLPIAPARDNAQISGDSSLTIIKMAVKVIAQYFQIPRDLVDLDAPERCPTGVKFKTRVPMRLRSQIFGVAEQVHKPGGIWQELYNALVDNHGWKPVQSRPDTSRSSMHEGRTKGGELAAVGTPRGATPTQNSARRGSGNRSSSPAVRRSQFSPGSPASRPQLSAR